jgi:hypothetical protein
MPSQNRFGQHRTEYAGGRLDIVNMEGIRSEKPRADATKDDTTEPITQVCGPMAVRAASDRINDTVVSW